VQLGSTVRFTEDGGPEESYRIVGPAEADPGHGRVSNESAVGKALLGRRVGEEATVEIGSEDSYKLTIVAID
jgi:transcription elongation factor GreA